MGLSDIPAEEVTIAKLLMRLRTSEGEILIDGQDIRKITQDDLLGILIFLRTCFVSPGVRDNIASSRKQNEKIIAVAKKLMRMNLFQNCLMATTPRSASGG